MNKKQQKIDDEMKKTIAIDFDGVIHKYSEGWKNGEIYDIPNEGAIESITKLIQTGYRVVIFTCRESEQFSEIKEWLQRRGINYPTLQKIEITNKKPIALIYIDDRGMRFTNWKDMMNYFV